MLQLAKDGSGSENISLQERKTNVPSAWLFVFGFIFCFCFCLFVCFPI